jgi:sodium pump decarboxylase gamma subunit
MDMWTITIIGVGTVFISLIVLALILSQFHRLFGPKPVAAKPSAAPTAAQAAPAIAKAGPDGAVIAAIAAAIAAATGRPLASFRIASVEASGGFNTPAWGRVERLSRAQGGR